MWNPARSNPADRSWQALAALWPLIFSGQGVTGIVRPIVARSAPAQERGGDVKAPSPRQYPLQNPQRFLLREEISTPFRTAELYSKQFNMRKMV
jgi:hypothetical protein